MGKLGRNGTMIINKSSGNTCFLSNRGDTSNIDDRISCCIRCDSCISSDSCVRNRCCIKVDCCGRNDVLCNCVHTSRATRDNGVTIRYGIHFKRCHSASSSSFYWIIFLFATFSSLTGGCFAACQSVPSNCSVTEFSLHNLDIQNETALHAKNDSLPPTVESGQIVTNDQISYTALESSRNLSKSANLQFVNKEHGETQSLNTEPAEAQSVNVEPAKTQTVNMEHVNTQFFDTNLADAHTVNTEPVSKHSINKQIVSIKHVNIDSKNIVNNISASLSNKTENIIDESIHLKETVSSSRHRDDGSNISKIIGITVPFSCVILLAGVIFIICQLSHRYKLCKPGARLRKCSIFCDNCVSTPYVYQVSDSMIDTSLTSSITNTSSSHLSRISVQTSSWTSETPAFNDSRKSRQAFNVVYTSLNYSNCSYDSGVSGQSCYYEGRNNVVQATFGRQMMTFPLVDKQRMPSVDTKRASSLGRNRIAVSSGDNHRASLSSVNRQRTPVVSLSRISEHTSEKHHKVKSYRIGNHNSSRLMSYTPRLVDQTLCSIQRPVSGGTLSSSKTASLSRGFGTHTLRGFSSHSNTIHTFGSSKKKLNKSENWLKSKT